MLARLANAYFAEFEIEHLAFLRKDIPSNILNFSGPRL